MAKGEISVKAFSGIEKNGTSIMAFIFGRGGRVGLGEAAATIRYDDMADGR